MMWRGGEGEKGWRGGKGGSIGEDSEVPLFPRSGKRKMGRQYRRVARFPSDGGGGEGHEMVPLFLRKLEGSG